MIGEDDRLMPEGAGEDNDLEVGDSVEYAGNSTFRGEVTKVEKRTVWVRSEDGETRRYDHKDLQEVGE